MFCLGLHAEYRCQHSGACCRADWPIPAEMHVRRAVEAHAIRVPGAVGPPFVGSDPVVSRNQDGTCVFLERGARGLCAIHRRAGVEALPSACRHFPRQILIDGRATFISLSHFCPTAAALLFTPGSLEIVHAPPTLRLDPPIEGLDATAALAPLVRPGMLCDLDGYDAWERACLDTLARPGLTAQRALDLIAGATEDVRGWRPDGGTLAARVAVAFDRASPAPERTSVDFAALCAAHFPPRSGPVPDGERVWDTLVEPTIDRFDPAIRRYLGARVFGNWIAYQGRGLRSIVEWLRTALAIVRNELTRRSAESGCRPEKGDAIEAIRATDLLLLHTSDSQALARSFATLEGADHA